MEGLDVDVGLMLADVKRNLTYSFDRAVPDYINHYMGRVATVYRGTLMPPSPGIHDYTYKVTFTGHSLQYTIEPTPREGFLELIKSLPKEQVLHRSRDVAISGQSLVAKEIRHRIEKLTKSKMQLDLIRSMLTDAQRHEISRCIAEITLKHLSFDWEHILAYIAEHETSSTGTGWRWGELEALGPSGWKYIFDQIRGFFQELPQHIDNGEFLMGPYNNGIRARSNQLSSIWQGGPISGEVERSRLVLFKAIVSMPGIFLLDKAAWYGEMLTEARSIWGGLPCEVLTPMTVGGQAYATVADWLKDGRQQIAYDGGAWESVVGTALSPYLNWACTSFGGYLHGASGMYNTSGQNQILSEIIASKLVKGNDKVCIFSDDINIYRKGKVGSPSTEFGALEEYQPDDSRMQFMLGLIYRYDPYTPRITGIKMTTDRADKSIPFSYQEGYDESRITGKSDERQTELWYGLYRGQFGGESLVDRLKNIPAAEFRGGSEEIWKSADEGFANYNLKELRAVA